jgi:hypothetical protein
LFVSVAISFENYRTVHPAYRDDEENEEESDEENEPSTGWGVYFISTFAERPNFKFQTTASAVY